MPTDDIIWYVERIEELERELAEARENAETRVHGLLVRMEGLSSTISTLTNQRNKARKELSEAREEMGRLRAAQTP